MTSTFDASIVEIGSQCRQPSSTRISAP